ncbi:TIGR04086 family membrane protein [Ruminococcus sp.]|uniref:TIGR04086 family membrane protein n=1 Tax=Ruminococcus sp. TaxID=41978 RepID=UPI0025F41BA7|nr:TIGR04086 family membrane protein [Ruminococcus sp.]MBO4524119.1 TIGR04086 family membrane protein [Ruminococcus sp.]
MRKQKHSIWTNAPLSAAVAVIFGLIITGMAWMLLSAVLFYIMRDMKLIKAFAAAALTTGAYTGSFLFGKYRRRKGLFGGLLCGALMFGAVNIAGIVILGVPTDIKKLLLFTVSGAAGGVAGVNSKRPKRLMNQ